MYVCIYIYIASYISIAHEMIHNLIVWVEVATDTWNCVILHHSS